MVPLIVTFPLIVSFDDQLPGCRADLPACHGHGGGLAGRRGQSQFRDHVHPVASAGARRTAPTAVDDQPAKLAGAGAVLQGTARPAARAGTRHLWFSWLSIAAGGGCPAVPGRGGAGWRRSIGAYRIRPRSGSTLQSSLWP